MLKENGAWKVESAGKISLPFSTFGEDNQGGLYAGVYQDGTVYKLNVR